MSIEKDNAYIDPHSLIPTCKYLDRDSLIVFFKTCKDYGDLMNDLKEISVNLKCDHNINEFKAFKNMDVYTFKCDENSFKPILTNGWPNEEVKDFAYFNSLPDQYLPKVIIINIGISNLARDYVKYKSSFSVKVQKRIDFDKSCLCITWLDYLNTPYGQDSEEIMNLGRLFRCPESFREGDLVRMRFKNLKTIDLSPYRIFELKTYVGTGSFDGCDHLETIVLPDTLRKIDCFCFRDCRSLRLIEIPDSVTFLGEKAFMGCIKLMDLKLPIGLKYIGDECFTGCVVLRRPEIPGTVEYVGKDVFDKKLC